MALAQLAPSLGELDRNLRRHHELLDAGPGREGRPRGLPGAGPDRLPAPGPGRRGLAPPGRPPAGRAGRRDRGPVGGRLVRRGIGRPPAVHRGGPARGRRDPPRPPQAVPADLRAVRRAPVLRGGRHAAGRAVAAGRRAGHRHLRGLLAPDRAPAARARRRADPHQRVVVAGPRPGRHQRGRAGHGDVVADADADLRPAHDLVRGLLQPGRGRRVDLVLGRFRGHRARPERRS